MPSAQPPTASVQNPTKTAPACTCDVAILANSVLAMFDRYGLCPEPDGYRLRECEILLWRKMNSVMERPWLAIDDFGHWFSKDSPNLYLIDPKLGLQPDDVGPLIERLSKG